GTGLTSYTTGDIPYASATNTLAKLSIGSAGQVLTVSGGNPVWAAGGGGGGWTDDGTIVRLTEVSDMVGIGTSVPTANLHIKSTDTTTVPFRVDYITTGGGGYSLPEGTWLYRKPITITNGGSALTLYQTSVTVNTQELITALKMQSAGQDIRFTDSGGSTLIDYWIESGINTTSTRIWVEVPNINASPATTTIYIYYGKSDAAAASSVANTFIREISNVIGDWHLDETTGSNAPDTSGNGRNGTSVNSPTWVAGKFWKALSFNGSNQYLNIPYTFFGTKPFSIGFWVNINASATASQNTFFSAGVNQFYWSPWGETEYIGFYNGGWSNTILTTTLPTKNQWVLLHYTISATGYQRLYYDTTEIAVQPNSPADYNLSPRFAYQDNWNYYLYGLQDECRIYNKELSVAEITDLYNNYGYTTTNYPGKVLVRKYASPEPIAGTPGTEETGSGTSTQSALYIQPNTGNVGIGTTAPGTYKCYINGTGYLGAAAWVYSSDRRLKENIRDIQSGLNVIEQLNPVRFDYINGDKKQVGFIAQEVREILSDIVTEGTNGMLGMKTDSIIPYLVGAIKELKSEYDKQQKEQQKQIDYLMKRVK
ncbi:MAG: DUF2341 domain-containing protein, partial [Elusimicrobiota bacterium]